MNGDISFFESEFGFSSMTFPCFLLYLFLAMAMIFLVRVFGPYAIKNYRLESDYDDGAGAVNVIYRIIAPVVWCYFLLCIVAIICSLLKFDLALTARWVPIALYWVEMLFLKISLRRFGIPAWAFVLEAFASIVIAVYFDWAVVCQLPSNGLLAIDQSNIGFQVVAAIFFAIVEIVISATVRKNYKTDYVVPYFSFFWENYYVRSFMPTEKKLYEYKRKYGKQLPKRFSDDILLRVVFYTIMFIEDTNRPKTVRIFENFLARMHFAKTTGIMQQKSSRVLTDEESVELAIPYIENMWDKYLKDYALSIESSYSEPFFTFTNTGYCYDYTSVSAALSGNFSLLYGDYCGTRNLRADNIFEEVRRFEEKENYGFVPEKILAGGAVFPEASDLISNEIVYWSDSHTLRIAAEIKPTLQIVSCKEKGENELRELVDLLESQGFKVISISFGPAVFQRLEIKSNEEGTLPYLDDNWVVSELD